MRTIIIGAVLLALSLNLAAQEYTPAQNPVGPESWWWDEQWWEEGQIPNPDNHPVRVEWSEYPSGDVTVPALVARPDDDRPYPAVLYQHGRRGLDELVQRQVKRIAARGFVVLAPDVYSAHFIEKLPIEHDYVVEQDVSLGLDQLLARPDVSTRRACLVSHTRGGYMTLKAATTHKRQSDAAACYVAWYPHLQDPNAPEPMQVYRYAPEIDQLLLPTMIFIGEQEQYQRRRSIETAVTSMQAAGRQVQLVVYPGVGRGFDFRPPHVRTLADDLASQDAVQRAARFMRRTLKTYAK
ncbi:dienelactone hydrolase family protein [Sedimenticola hydrogenitrophicus]|uniref:dienelactone hydrolase family protein n=1 Tax=Sedimenticola hydrogenitrophicus TaxID=2967975 RepID=UPI0021A4292F|nr:dienelactone hydrolase family protein [Sedimenticola hydrogenitrophicus]